MKASVTSLVVCLAAGLASASTLAQGVILSNDMALMYDQAPPTHSGDGKGEGTAVAAADPPPVNEVKATAAQSKSIINAGKIADSDVKTILGDKYGKGAFKILLESDGGAEVGFVPGNFTTSGSLVYSPVYFIPPVQKVYQATIVVNDGDAAVLDNQLNTLSYDDTRSLTQFTYGPFYLTLTNPSRHLQGFLNGSVTENSYNYSWGYHYI